tara:strand:+ start:16382 stop:19660 length:3279 start_codon:yes stop_codon:yes gene_type:complete
MAYKRSTSFSGYRQRITPDKSRELADRAKALEKQRKESVKGMERASSQQLTELNRLSNLEARSDQYELENLSKFSKAINDAVQVSAKTFGVDYIERKRQEAIDDYRAGLAGDKDALAKTDLNLSQVQEIESRINELDEEREVKFTEIEKKLKFSDLETKYRLLNARKLGSNYAYGYSKAHLLESAKGFMPWFMNSTQENNTVIGERLDGTELKVNDYDALFESEDRKQVEDFLIREYEKKSNIASLNPKIVNAYLTQSVVKQVQEFRTKKLNDEIQADAAEKIRLQNVNLDTAINLFELKTNDKGEVIEVGNFSDAVNNILVTGRGLHFKAGTTGASGEANKDNLRAVFVDSTSQLDEDVKILKLIDYIQNKKFNIPNLGNKTLVEAFPIKFDVDKLKADIFAKREDNLTKLTRAKTKELNIKIATLKFQYDTEKIDKVTYLGTVKEYQKDANYAAVTNRTQIFTDALKYSPQYQNTENGLAQARKEINNFGTVSAETYTSLKLEDQKLIKEDQISTGLRWDQTLEGKKLLKEYIGDGGKIKDALTTSFLGAGKALNVSGSKDVTLQNAIEFAETKYVYEVYRNFKNTYKGEIPENMDPDMFFWKMAAESVVLQAQQAKGADLGSNPFAMTFASDSIQGVFANPKFAEVQKGSFAYSAINDLQESKDELNRISSMLNESVSNDALLDLAEKIFDTDLRKTRLNFLQNDGVYSGESQFVINLAQRDPLKRDPFTLANALREKLNLPIVDINVIPEESRNLINFYKTLSVETRNLLQSRYSVERERGINMAGLISVNDLHRAIVSTGINYDDLDDGEIAAALTIFNERDPENKVTRIQYDNDDTIKEKIFKIHVNSLLKEAIAATDNKEIAIQMVAASFGSGNMNEYATQQNRRITRSLLNSYYRGWNPDTKKDLWNVVERDDGSIIKVSADLSLDTVDMTSGGVQLALDNLEENVPSQFTIGKNNRKQVNPAYRKYEQTKEKLLAQKRVLQYLEGNYSSKSVAYDINSDDIFWGLLGVNIPSKDMYYDVRAVLGPKNFKEFLAEVDKKFFEETVYTERPRGLLGNRKQQRMYSDIVLRELKKLDQFFITSNNE